MSVVLSLVMTEAEQEQDNSRMVILGAIALAAVAAGILWYLFIFRQAPGDEEQLATDVAASPTPLFAEGERVDTETTPAVLTTPTPRINGQQAAVTTRPSPAVAAAVAPSAATGAGEWFLAGSFAALMAGLFGLRKTLS